MLKKSLPLALALLVTASLALTQDTLQRHELNNCQIDVRDDRDPPVVTVYAKPSSTAGSPGATFVLLGPTPSNGGIRMQDMKKVAYKDFVPLASNRISFVRDGTTNTLKIEIDNGDGSPTTSAATYTTGTYYEDGPFSYGYEEVRGPGGDIGGEQRTLLVWFRNRGLESGFLLTDL